MGVSVTADEARPSRRTVLRDMAVGGAGVAVPGLVLSACSGSLETEAAPASPSPGTSRSEPGSGLTSNGYGHTDADFAHARLSRDRVQRSRPVRPRHGPAERRPSDVTKVIVRDGSVRAARWKRFMPGGWSGMRGGRRARSAVPGGGPGCRSAGWVTD